MPTASLPLAERLAGLTSPADREARERLLLQGLADPSPLVRQAAVALAAREVEPERLIPLVAERADSVLRNSALATLERQGPYARTAVEQAAYSKDKDLAMFACQVLATIGGESSVPALLHALGRRDVNIVQAATEALGKLRRPEAVEPLTELLTREPWLQLAAVDALGAIADPAVTAPLLSLVPDTMVAEPALEALALVAAPAGLPRLLTLLLEPGTRELWPALLRAAGAVIRRAGFTPGAAATELATFGRKVDSDHAPGTLWHFLAERLSGEHEDEQRAGVDDRSRARGTGVALQSASAMVLASGISSLLPLVVRWGESPASRAWLAPLAQQYLGFLTPHSGSLLAHPDSGVRAGTLGLLPPAVAGGAALCRGLDDPAAPVRIAACQALAQLPEPFAAIRLTELLDQGSGPERVAAAEALVRLPESTYLPILGKRLESPDEATQLAVLTALAEVHAPALEDTLLRIAPQLSGPTRRAGYRAVARIPGSRSEVLLLRALADRDQSLQMEALDLLVMRGGNKVRTTLLVLLGVHDSLRYHVIRALGRLGQPEVAEPLIAVYPDAQLHERIEILTALSRLSGQEAMPFLLGAFQDRQPEIRRVAAQALAAHAGPDNLDLLTDLARDEDWVIRAEAARALGRLGAAARPLLLELGRDLELTVARAARTARAGQ